MRDDHKRSLNRRRHKPWQAFRPWVEHVENRVLLTTFLVTNTGDNLGVNPAPFAGTGTLRQAIIDSNATGSSGSNVTSQIDFAIPAATDSLFDTPVPGFDPGTQTWTINLGSPLPTITSPVTIDGYSQAEVGVPFRYPTQAGLAIQTLSVLGSPTGGTFSLTGLPADPFTPTPPIPWDATAAQVKAAIEAVDGPGTATVTGGPFPNNEMTLTFGGAFARQVVGPLTLAPADNHLTGGVNPGFLATSISLGGIVSDPTLITSTPNTVTAVDGNNAHSQVIIEDVLQELRVQGNPTGGTFTLTSSLPGHSGTTAPIPSNASAAAVQVSLETLFGAGNVTVTGGPAPSSPMRIDFTGQLVGQAIPLLTADSGHLTGGVGPAVAVSYIPRLREPGFVFSPPTSTAPGASHSTLRGLILDGFTTGVMIPDPSVVGVIIQGNYIGDYVVYPVNIYSGEKLPTTDVSLVTIGNTQGVVLNSNNAKVGGTNPQEDNVISGNAQQGILIQPDATGNVVQGNQIGIVSTAASNTGSSAGNLYFPAGNGAEGVLVFGASNQIGGPSPAAGNLISANGSHGVRISGSTASGTLVAANIIGLGPGGGYLFGTGNPGNGDYGDGVHIENSAGNLIGGPTASSGNTISSNFGAGVYITGATSADNTVENNKIGVIADGTAAKGNALDGVTVLSPSTTVGPGNIISGNLRGVDISNTAGAVVRDNLIGTDSTGTVDLGNAREGVLIDNATDSTITGNSTGSQVISGNLVGVAIQGALSARNLVAGNLIGSDKTGLAPLPNAQEGVLIDSSAGNTIGGSTSAARNLISANHWGVRITGASAASNVVQGNFIGTDITGAAPLGNELQGVIITLGASGNFIGGSTAAAGNIIAFNGAEGVNVESGVSNTILTNSIFSNALEGIELLPGANHDQPAPVLSSIQSAGSNSVIVGTVQGTPSTLYTVQFFSNPTPGEQGQTFLGQVTVTTDSSGSAQFTATLPVALGASQPFITATATSASGDTSEFSESGTATPLNVEFSMASYVVNQSAGTVTITVVRSSGIAAGTVNYATSDGTAKAQVNYVTTSGVLSFDAGVTQKTFTIPILNTGLMGGTLVFFVTLSNPTPAGVMVLGTPSTASVTILGFTSPGPSVENLQLLSDHRGITGIVLFFSEPLDPVRAVNLLNYNYSVQAAGKDQQFGTLDDLLFGIASAVYNPANQSVTLRLVTPVRCNSFIRLTINQLTDNPAQPIGVSDITGNLLDGNNDGRPGGVFVATFAMGQHFSYLDNSGNSVGLRLSGGGTMQLVRRANGSAWQLSLLKTVPGRSVLSGQVHPATSGATGVTTIGSIVGLAGVRNLLTNPPFIVGGSSAAPDSASGPSIQKRHVLAKPALRSLPRISLHRSMVPRSRPR